MERISDSTPDGIDATGDDEAIRVFHESHRAIWLHERALLQNPLIDIHSFSFTAGPVVVVNGPPSIITTETAVKTEVPAAVADFDVEMVANSGGLILPTDREVVIYDYEPDFYDVVEWPSGSGNLFSIAKKYTIPYSGRCELQIRSNNILQGVVYRRLTNNTYDAANWKNVLTYSDIVIPAMVDELRAREKNMFYGRIGPEDKTFFVLQSKLTLDGLATFVPSIQDVLYDSAGVEWRIREHAFDSKEKFYTIVAYRTTETDAETV